MENMRTKNENGKYASKWTLDKFENEQKIVIFSETKKFKLIFIFWKLKTFIYKI